jgi:hypothetical protein
VLQPVMAVMAVLAAQAQQGVLVAQAVSEQAVLVGLQVPVELEVQLTAHQAAKQLAAMAVLAELPPARLADQQATNR